MSDQKLRDLERRWKESGTVQDEAAYLLERVRVGDLTRERLELAAYCGHAAATLALAGRPPTLRAQPGMFFEDHGIDPESATPLDHLEAWCFSLEPWGLKLAVACGFSAAQLVIDSIGLDVDLTRRVLAAREAIAAWLDTPTPETAAACGQARYRLLDSVERLEHDSRVSTLHLQAIYSVAGAPDDDHPYAGLQGVVSTAQALVVRGATEQRACEMARAAACQAAIKFALLDC